MRGILNQHGSRGRATLVVSLLVMLVANLVIQVLPGSACGCSVLQGCKMACASPAQASAAASAQRPGCAKCVTAPGTQQPGGSEGSLRARCDCAHGDASLDVTLVRAQESSVRSAPAAQATFAVAPAALRAPVVTLAREHLDLRARPPGRSALELCCRLLL